MQQEQVHYSALLYEDKKGRKKNGRRCINWRKSHGIKPNEKQGSMKIKMTSTLSTAQNMHREGKERDRGKIAREKQSERCVMVKML